MEDFSLIILCKERGHLLPLTLDTLKPQNGSFEVLLVGPEGMNKMDELVHCYPNLKLKVLNAKAPNLAGMMNEGMMQAQGKYVQFLEPGDRYISQHGIEFLKTLIQNEPHLIYSDSLVQGGVSSSNFITARFPWFLKTKLSELGGFDGSLSSCPSMDLLCKLSQDQKLQSVFCKRVLVDSENEKIIPLRETCKVLYRHFGFLHTLKWFCFQNPPQLLHRTATFFKEAFWGS